MVLSFSVCKIRFFSSCKGLIGFPCSFLYLISKALPISSIAPKDWFVPNAKTLAVLSLPILLIILSNTSCLYSSGTSTSISYTLFFNIFTLNNLVGIDYIFILLIQIRAWYFQIRNFTVNVLLADSRLGYKLYTKFKNNL